MMVPYLRPPVSASCSTLEQIISVGALEFTGLHWKFAPRIEMTQKIHPVPGTFCTLLSDMTPRIKAKVNWLRKEVKVTRK